MACIFPAFVFNTVFWNQLVIVCSLPFLDHEKYSKKGRLLWLYYYVATYSLPSECKKLYLIDHYFIKTCMKKDVKLSQLFNLRKLLWQQQYLQYDTLHTQHKHILRCLLIWPISDTMICLALHLSVLYWACVYHYLTTI